MISTVFCAIVTIDEDVIFYQESTRLASDVQPAELKVEDLKISLPDADSDSPEAYTIPSNAIQLSQYISNHLQYQTLRVNKLFMLDSPFKFVTEPQNKQEWKVILYQDKSITVAIVCQFFDVRFALYSSRNLSTCIHNTDQLQFKSNQNGNRSIIYVSPPKIPTIFH